jgi:hypothetical protein
MPQALGLSSPSPKGYAAVKLILEVTLGNTYHNIAPKQQETAKPGEK